MTKQLDMVLIDKRLRAFALSTDLDAQYLSADGKVRIFSHECLGCLFCDAMRSCEEGAHRCHASHLEAGQSAFRFGETYISRCHAGLVMLTSPVMLGDEYMGCVSCQPVMMWEWDEVAVTEFIQRTRDLNIPTELMLARSKDIKFLDTKRARAIADMLQMLAVGLTGEESRRLTQQKDLQAQQMRINEIVTEQKRHTRLADMADTEAYPMNKERELLGKVRLGDKNGARAILNDLLGHIFYRAAGNLETMKARILELVVMISRAAVESGAELEKLLGLNYHFISELSALTNYEDVCLWVVKVLDTFLEQVYESRNVKNSGVMADALNYIRAHYMENLALDDVARQVHISPFYLSHMFKEELSITFVEYLTRVRMEQARQLLSRTQQSIAEIAEDVGYEDAGYFSKVFKKATGVSPKQYRRGT